jgi:hypothetical protein
MELRKKQQDSAELQFFILQKVSREVIPTKRERGAPRDSISSVGHCGSAICSTAGHTISPSTNPTRMQIKRACSRGTREKQGGGGVLTSE